MTPAAKGERCASWQRSAQGGQQGPISVIEPWLVDVTALDGEFVTEDKDLDVLVVGGAEAEDH